MKRLALAALAVLWASAAWAGSPVAICGLSGTSGQSNCVIPNDDGSINVTSGASGTTDVNLSKVGGSTVDTGIGTGGSATLRTAIDTSQVLTAGTPGAPASATLSTQYPFACTPGVDIADASTNATAVTGAAATLCSLDAINTTTTLYYLLVFNKVAAPTCNSDTPVHVYPIPPASAAGGAGGIVKGLGPFGEAFSLGFGYCITAAVAGTGNAAVGVFVNYSTHLVQ